MSNIDTLILGASGPIGTKLMAQTRRAGLLPLGVSRNSDVKVDVTDVRQLTDLLASTTPQTVVYLSTPPNQLLETDSKLVSVMVDAAVRSAELSAKFGAERFIVSSSSAVYGTTAQTPLSENSPLLGQGAYSRLKSETDTRLLELFGMSSSILRILRIFNVYGPGCSSSLINQLSSRHTKVWDTEQFVRDYIHVSDVAAAIMAARTYSEKSTVFNVGTGIGTSNAEILNLVRNWSPARPVSYSGDSSFSVANTDLALRELRFHSENRLPKYLKHRRQFV